MNVKLLTEHHLEFLCLKVGCRGSSESTLVKISNCWKSHAAAHIACVLFQHLVWILGLKPSAGGSLKAGQQLNDSTNAVITTAVMADLPVLSSMLSRLFESSQ